MSSPTKLGLLPLYVKLYDDVMPEMRGTLEDFLGKIDSEFRRRGFEVVTAPVCRVKDEFERAVNLFEDARVDAIVTLHLAYSPSLESADILSRTKLPLIVLDTTTTYEFGPDQKPEEFLYNHGIHGVQDFCNLLIRNGKDFHIEAGHWEKSDVIDRVASWVRAARIASNMRSSRVGQIGGPFEGMGDFQISQEALDSIGIRAVPVDFKYLASMVPSEDDPGVAAEMKSNLAEYACEGVDETAHNRSVRISIGVRKWIEKEQLSAWTLNFNDVNRSSGLPTMPFLEASKSLASGIGYAGEGDVITAALVGALLKQYQETTFTEMFCPDWAGNRIFLSHMGELNPSLLKGKAELVEKPMPWIDIDTPALVVGRFKGGNAVFVNLAPGPDDTFTLILAPVEMDESGNENMPGMVRGWFRPEMPVQDFLAAYSSVGGTHHAAMVYGAVLDDLEKFGELMGWNVVVLG